MQTINYRGKTYRVLEISSPYGNESVIAVPTNYISDNGGKGPLAIQLLCVQDGIIVDCYAILTVNIDPYSGLGLQSDTRAYVDTNNNGHWGCLDFISKYGLGKSTGILTPSGYCLYPLYEFNLEKCYA